MVSSHVAVDELFLLSLLIKIKCNLLIGLLFFYIWSFRLHGVCNENPLAPFIRGLGLRLYRTSGDNSVLYDHDLERYYFEFNYLDFFVVFLL